MVVCKGTDQADTRPSQIHRVACQPQLTRSLASVSEGWSGLRESNPSSWLGKPEHYHYAKPAFFRLYRMDSGDLKVSGYPRLVESTSGSFQKPGGVLDPQSDFTEGDDVGQISGA